jgi:hypothetical protein
MSARARPRRTRERSFQQRSQVSSQRLAPFGNPDAGRAEVEELWSGSVDFGDDTSFGGLATAFIDDQAAIIVGPRGCGKTDYIRRLRDSRRDQPNTYVYDARNNPLTTERIAGFCLQFAPGLLVEKWQIIWRKAILGSVASHILCNPDLSALVPADSLRTLSERYERIFQGTSYPLSFADQLGRLLGPYDDTSRASHAVNVPLDHFEESLRQSLSHLPFIYCYLDEMDENFLLAPLFWAACLKGLVAAALQFLQEGPYRSHVRVVVAVHDVVLRELGTQNLNDALLREPHVHVLQWDRSALSSLLLRKLEILPVDMFLGDPLTERSAATWLGYPTDQTDELSEMLLGDLFGPRDLVVLGNALCQQVLTCKRGHQATLATSVLGRQVSAVLASQGRSRLRQCAAETGWIAVGRAWDRLTEEGVWHTAATAIDQAEVELAAAVRELGSGVLSHGQLTAVWPRPASAIGQGIDLLSLLWRHGLIGQASSDGSLVFGSNEAPVGAPGILGYKLHRSVLETI